MGGHPPTWGPIPSVGTVLSDQRHPSRVSLVHLAVLATLLTASVGCLGTDGAAVEPTGQLEETEPVASPPRPELVQPRFLDPVLLGQVCCGGAEPNVAVGPTGEIYVSSTGALWRSDDGGESYQSLNEERCRVGGSLVACLVNFERHPSLDGAGDTDIVVTPDGAVHWLALYGDGGVVPYQVSTDAGATFSQPVDLATVDQADREWLAGRDDGRLYATWRENGEEDRIVFRRSLDGGETWSRGVAIAEDDLQGPIAVDPTGPRIYTPYASYSYDGSIRIARSLDDGTTWESVLAVPPDGVDRSEREANPTYLFPVAAVDQAGTVYLVWSNDADGGLAQGAKELAVPSVWLVKSQDHGATWSQPEQMSPPGKAAIFPWIEAGAEGRVAVAWYENVLGLPNEALPDLWNVQLVQSVDADKQGPTFVGGQANDEPFHIGAICTSGGGCAFQDTSIRYKDRTMLDFFELALTPEGLPVVAWAADGSQARDVVRVFAGGVAEGTPMFG